MLYVEVVLDNDHSEYARLNRELIRLEYDARQTANPESTAYNPKRNIEIRKRIMEVKPQVEKAWKAFMLTTARNTIEIQREQKF